MLWWLYAACRRAGAPRSVNEGVYTAEQAKRGEAVYKEQCAHLPRRQPRRFRPDAGAGGQGFPGELAGEDRGDLFEKTHTTMPATAPGSLTEQQAADIVAYMLGVAKYRPARTELEAKVEPLKQIKIDAEVAPAPGELSGPLGAVHRLRSGTVPLRSSGSPAGARRGHPPIPR